MCFGFGCASFLTTLSVKLFLSSQRTAQLQGLQVPDFEQKKKRNNERNQQRTKNELNAVGITGSLRSYQQKITHAHVGVHQI